MDSKELVPFEMKADTTDAIKSLASALVNTAKGAIKDKIIGIAKKNKEILDDLNRKLSEAEGKMIAELGKIDEVLGVYETNEKTNKKVRIGGALDQARKKVKTITKKWKEALQAAKKLEDEAHEYLLEEEKLEEMRKQQQPVPRYTLNTQIMKVEEKEKKYKEWEKTNQQVELIWDELQAAKDELSKYEAMEESFRKVDPSLLEDDRESALTTNDTLGHYVTTHWGAKVKRLRILIEFMHNLYVSSHSPEIIRKFQNIFNEDCERILFNTFIRTLKDVTNASFFNNFEFTEDQKEEFIEEIFREMPNNLIDQFNPFYSFLHDSADIQVNDDEDLQGSGINIKVDKVLGYHSTSYVKVIDEGHGVIKKTLDLEKIPESDISKNFNAFMSKHFRQACIRALNMIKLKRSNFESEWIEKDQDDENDRENSKADRQMVNDGRIETVDDKSNPDIVDDPTVSFWAETREYLLSNVNDMVSDAVISMKDNLPETSYYARISEQKAREDVKKIFQRLIGCVDREITSSRKISNILKEILLQATGGIKDSEELKIGYNIIYATLQLYIYKYMLLSEEELIKQYGGRKDSQDVMENLQEKIDRAQIAINSPNTNDFQTFRASTRPQIEKKVDFLLDGKLTNTSDSGKGQRPNITDGSGVFNQYVIDGTPFRR